jgi:predicted HicB family RNase H-like nuclease
MTTTEQARELKTEIVHARVDQQLAAAIRRRAAAEDRSVSSYVGRTLRQHFAAEEPDVDG